MTKLMDLTTLLEPTADVTSKPSSTTVTQRFDNVNSLWYGTKGAIDAPIVFVAESWGSEESKAKIPLVGQSGQELDRMLALAGIPHDQILFTNVVAAQPRGNETWRFFEPKATFHQPRVRGLALSSLVRNEVSRLYRQIGAHPRRLVIAAGNYALWALSENTDAKVLAASNGRPIPTDEQTWVPNGIMTWRGSMTYVTPIPEFTHDTVNQVELSRMKLLPIVHPAGILRAWYLREPTIHDLRIRVPMALRNDWRRSPKPIFFAPPTFEQATTKLQEWLDYASAATPIRLASDIETRVPLITCIGFADSEHFAMSIPFVRKDPTHGFDSYWTPQQEATLVSLIRAIYTHPHIEIDGQNFIYDTQYIQRWLGVTPHLHWDTMLCQNVIFPGVPKGLDYLASMYCTYYWFWKEDGKEWDTTGTLEQHLEYNCLDLVNTHEVGTSQRALVRHLGMEAQMAFKMRVHGLCLRMMNRGVRYDKTSRGPMLFRLQSAQAQLEKELLEIIPQEWIAPVGKRTKANGGGPIYWITSDKQKRYLFYEFLGFREVRDPKTGSLTVGSKAMGQFRMWYPEYVGLIDRLENIASLENTINVIGMQIDHDGRARCSYNPGGAETHRLTSSKNVFGGGTNLQNLTMGDEDE